MMPPSENVENVEAVTRTEAGVVADVARRAADTAAGPINAETAEPHVTLLRLRTDESLRITDQERFAEHPRRRSGTATLQRAASFTAYVERLATTESTTVWADPTAHNGAGAVTAVFNDHDDTAAGWRDHRCVWRPELDADWTEWVLNSGQLGPQKKLAQFLQDHLHNLHVPEQPRRDDVTPGKLMEAVLEFKAQRNAKYASVVNMTNGALNLTYEEQINQQPQGTKVVRMPERFTLDLFPYAGAQADDAAFEIVAEIRYEIPAEGGALQIGYRLVRPDLVLRQAWEREIARIEDTLPATAPLFHGTAPAESAATARPKAE